MKSLTQIQAIKFSSSDSEGSDYSYVSSENEEKTENNQGGILLYEKNEILKYIYRSRKECSATERSDESFFFNSPRIQKEHGTRKL